MSVDMIKILIIDDDWQILQLVGEFLRRQGYEIATAANGGQGLILIADFAPDLILCDLDMPGVNGQEFVSHLRRDEKYGEIPVIFLSGCMERKQIRQSINLGGDDFIHKPVELQEILETIKARVSRLNSQRRRNTRVFEQAADIVAGIINNPGQSKSGIKWWDNLGKSRLNPPNPILHQVDKIMHGQQSATDGQPSPQFNPSALLVKDGNRRHYLQLSEVKVFLANGEYSEVCWGDNRHMFFRKALKQWGRELPSEQFVRVHRSAIINLAFLDHVQKDASGKEHIHMQRFNQVIPVSQRAKSVFNRRLKSYRPTPLQITHEIKGSSSD
jgi:CheY-like chemotaxis protein